MYVSTYNVVFCGQVMLCRVDYTYLLSTLSTARPYSTAMSCFRTQGTMTTWTTTRARSSWPSDTSCRWRQWVCSQASVFLFMVDSSRNMHLYTQPSNHAFLWFARLADDRTGRLKACAIRPAGIYGEGEMRHFPRIIKLLNAGRSVSHVMYRRVSRVSVVRVNAIVGRVQTASLVVLI